MMCLHVSEDRALFCIAFGAGRSEMKNNLLVFWGVFFRSDFILMLYENVWQ